MSGLYKTPGVYVEEIPKFPPSIAAVETAIPAFIGYTEKAIRNGVSLLPISVTNPPVAIRVESIAEYEEIFGGGPAQDVVIYLDNNNNFVNGNGKNEFYLYDSLRMFYANGGGKCYIISVGNYSDALSSTNITAGLKALEGEDEPTIILVPDAVALGGGLYGTQQIALAQCAKLMDRVTICDLEKSTTSTNNDFKVTVDAFRNSIGINDLKYGAAYGPWINTTLPRQIWLRNLTFKRFGAGSDVQLESMTSDIRLLEIIADTRLAEITEKNITNREGTLSGGSGKKLGDALTAALDEWRKINNLTPPSGTTLPTIGSTLQIFTDLTFKVLSEIQALFLVTNTYPTNTKFELKKAITDYLQSPTLKSSIITLTAHHNYLGGISAANKIVIISSTVVNSDFDNTAKLLGYTSSTAFTDLLTAGNPSTVGSFYPTDAPTPILHKERAEVAFPAIYTALTEAISFFQFIHANINSFEKTLNDALTASFGKLKDLTAKGADALNILPPSGAIAGIYAKVDRDRGVWKAPANVSLNAVIGPAVKISHEQQGEYNVDVNAGKSINIIRSFTGKGTLVWGARTLAGNDNEWRYVPVRRLFNMVEESVKKATEQFVFEPNDANTWVKVQAMIENFLNTLWRQGALQGVKPEHAFYVAVGLGKTMTALDILEGRMIIEIGMAAVRPAEFIILKFSHKMAES